jgi:4-hydroxy-tetrahydrodipicolinate reductase
MEMKIALIGHGAMGSLIERLAFEKGHEIAVVFDESDSERTTLEFAGKLHGAQVAIDFTASSAVRRNVEACLAAGVPLVEGTTGWNEDLEAIRRMVTDSHGSMVYGANFSIGVNLFYKIAEYSAELFAKFPDYEAFIEEQHHLRKKDAPSGTALKLKDLVSKHIDIGDIASTRVGNIPGTHRVGFDGPSDQILLQHMARSREGFAFGAILAAEWILGKTGFYEFDDVIDEIVMV